MTSVGDRSQRRTIAAATIMGLLAATLATASGQDKPPAFVIAAPTVAQLAAGPSPAALPMDVNDARVQMGWPAFLATRTILGLSTTRIAIVDSGFKGLAEWLAAHPDERERTTLI